MILREQLLDQLAAQGAARDYQRLAADVLGIRGASPALARTLVEQALVIEDWRERWRQVGKIAVRKAPSAPGVYVFRDWSGGVLYVGKAMNLRRRLAAHFAERRWRTLPPALARVITVEWQAVGSEIEALLREATLIRDLRPLVNVQRAAPTFATRAIPASLIRDVVLVLPSIDSNVATLLAARADGSILLQHTLRSGVELERHSWELWEFFGHRTCTAHESFAALVFSWLAHRGQRTTRVYPADAGVLSELRRQLSQLLADKNVFAERLVSI
jgi:predicted GIY-YIG superfamily endonuclease